MLAKVINYGRAGNFATCLGNIYLPRGIEHSLEVTNPLAAKELAAFPYVEVKIIEPEEKTKLETKYKKYTINQLRHLAAQKGLKRVNTAKKANIIKKLLEE